MEDSALARISIDPEICGGRPCIRGTRMRISDLIEMLASGATKTDILADLTEDDIGERDHGCPGLANQSTAIADTSTLIACGGSIRQRCGSRSDAGDNSV